MDTKLTGLNLVWKYIEKLLKIVLLCNPESLNSENRKLYLAQKTMVKIRGHK